MDEAIACAPRDDCKKDCLHSQDRISEDIESAEACCYSKSLVSGIKPEDVLVLNVKKSQVKNFCIQNLYLQRISSIEKRIPKQIASTDEIYLRHCMEVIHLSALRAVTSNKSSEFDVLSDGFKSRLISATSGPDASFVFASETENCFTGSNGESVLGTITGSTSMINILKSPLFRQLGGSDHAIAVNSRRTNLLDPREPNLLDSREPMNSTVTSSQEDFCFWPREGLNKERIVLEDRKSTNELAHKRFASMSSSTNSTLSDSSSSSSSCSSTSTTFSQGMLHCSWNSGLPHYVFSINDQRETYLANLLKVESSDDKAFDYVYMFHSRSGGKKGEWIHEKESDHVGIMRVSTSLNFCTNNIEIMETQFVLCATDDNTLRETQTASDTLRKNNGVSKKIGGALKSGRSYRQRTSSRFWGSSAISENSLDACQSSSSTGDQVPGAMAPEYNVTPNNELAAIIVRKHVRENHNKKIVIGGWGMKFLKKNGNRKPNTSLEATASCEYCQHNNGDCSTRMEVLVPAGLHGGPRTRSSGPSSLIERWQGHGHCDCGGWDIGCPLTVLNSKPSNKEVLPRADGAGVSSFDLYIQGSKPNTPMVKMVNIHDGLYYIHYQSSLSALQSLSIAVAFIHSRSPTLQPKSI